MNTMSPELPRKANETFLEYLHRLAVFKGYLPAGSSPTEPKAMPPTREPGEDG